MDNKGLNRKPGHSTAGKSATEVSEDRPSLPLEEILEARSAVPRCTGSAHS